MPVSRGRPVWRSARATIDYDNFYNRPIVEGRTPPAFDFESLYEFGGPTLPFLGAKVSLMNSEGESSDEEESAAEKSSVDEEEDDDSLGGSPKREQENLEMLLALPMSEELICSSNATKSTAEPSKPLSRSLRSAIDKLSASYEPQTIPRTERQSSYEDPENLALDPHNEEAFPAMPTSKTPTIEHHETNLPSYASMASKPVPPGPQPAFKKRIQGYDRKRYLMWPQARDCIHYIPFGKQLGDTASRKFKPTSANAGFTSSSQVGGRKVKDEQPYVYKSTKEQTLEWQAKQALKAALDEVIDDEGSKQVRGHMRPCEKLQGTGLGGEEMASDWKGGARCDDREGFRAVRW